MGYLLTPDLPHKGNSFSEDNLKKQKPPAAETHQAGVSQPQTITNVWRTIIIINIIIIIIIIIINIIIITMIKELQSQHTEKNRVQTILINTLPTSLHWQNKKLHNTARWRRPSSSNSFFFCFNRKMTSNTNSSVKKISSQFAVEELNWFSSQQLQDEVKANSV